MAPLKEAQLISVIVEFSFFIDAFNNLILSNFKSDEITSLANLLIDLISKTRTKSESILEKTLLIVKTKNFNEITKESLELLKYEMSTFCSFYKLEPTFIFLKHKNLSGFYHKHYSSFNEK